MSTATKLKDVPRGAYEAGIIAGGDLWWICAVVLAAVLMLGLVVALVVALQCMHKDVHDLRMKHAELVRNRTDTVHEMRRVSSVNMTRRPSGSHSQLQSMRVDGSGGYNPERVGEHGNGGGAAYPTGRAPMSSGSMHSSGGGSSYGRLDDMQGHESYGIGRQSSMMPRSGGGSVYGQRPPVGPASGDTPSPQQQLSQRTHTVTVSPPPPPPPPPPSKIGTSSPTVAVTDLATTTPPPLHRTGSILKRRSSTVDVHDPASIGTPTTDEVTAVPHSSPKAPPKSNLAKDDETASPRQLRHQTSSVSFRFDT